MLDLNNHQFKEKKIILKKKKEEIFGKNVKKFWKKKFSGKYPKRNG